ncbi:serine hydrolase domain-containing protein [Robertkochia flava]|uniref:serine hydrolase domain-containing protein n=1 Tax=Robertkochia flava TaxID=3447986 RepID=UPI001CCB161C|nr:serine hydrolase [Robertkochia marina]
MSIKTNIPFQLRIIFFIGLITSVPVSAQSDYYFPDRNAVWEKVTPAEAGFNEEKLQQAVNFALANEYAGERDLRIAILKGFAHEPYHQISGPVKERGGPAGMILKKGYAVASWGDLRRVDMTFSVTKSYLSTVAGLAWDKKLVRDVDDMVSHYVWDDTFKGAHNSKITWRHLLNQSSDWYGTLWGGHDWADRPPKEGGVDEWRNRTLHEPGTFFKYNDVRVNLLAYSLLQVWRKPLPSVLKENIMDPIGASSTWRWFGYDNAWVNVDGLRMQSVTGGGHSGGGLFINTEDHARFGLLFLNRGKWKDRQLISEDWIKLATEPSLAKADYGFMWWLNSENRFKDFSDNVFMAAGFGGNFIVVIPQHDLVVVTRWLEPSQLERFMELVAEAVN